MPLVRLARAHHISSLTFAVLVTACNTYSTLPYVAPSIQTSSPTAGVTATIAGDRVQIRNDLQAPVEYALIEEYWLEHALADWCFGSGGCGTSIPHGQTATPLVSSATGMTPGATKVVVVWWAIPDEPPPMGGPTTPYKIVLDVR
jgi:hypothetical protein